MGPARNKSATKAPPKRKAATAKRTSSGGTPVWQNAIDAVAFLEPRYGDKVPRQKVASICGFPHQKVSNWANSLTDLKNKKMYIECDKDFIWLTALGKKHANKTDPASGNKDLLEKAKEKIKSSKGKAMIDMLSDGRTYSRVKVAATLGMDPKKGLCQHYVYLAYHGRVGVRPGRSWRARSSFARLALSFWTSWDIVE
jgi:hypothetical protein